MVAALLVAAVLTAPARAAAAGPGTPDRAGIGARICPTQPSPSPVATSTGWAQGRYDLPDLGRISRGDGVTVAVLDSGVDPAHPQLAAAVRGGGDMLEASGRGLDDCAGHGTAVASIIAARPTAGSGLLGVAPAATILSIRVGDRIETDNGLVGSGDIAELVAGIHAAVAARPKPAVLNLSISTTTDSPALRAAIRDALDAEIVVVAAVGNDFQRGNPTPFPAAYDGVVGVGAIDGTGARYAQSQVGPYVDLVAPGDRVLAAARGSGHVLVSGTSFAVPFVAATAALIRARWPSLSRAEVVRRLIATADPPSGGQPSPEYGYGVVNPLRALTEVVPASTPTVLERRTPVVPPAARQPAPGTAPSARVLATSGALLFAALLVIALALAAPAGRRRHWRPGRLQDD
ncbi:MAG TPA: type VII secretion-associated serine protease mycosin [Micromonosporaceae bacterium]|jgi:type VII secretion-associated serine protease mycosin